jgi:hypothetical protein
MKFFILLFVFNVLFIANDTYSQNIQINCSATNENSGLQAVEGGLYKPSANASGEYFRALFVFAQFQSDTENIPDWPKNSLPIWANNIIDSAPSSSYRAYTISDYFKRM